MKCAAGFSLVDFASLLLRVCPSEKFRAKRESGEFLVALAIQGAKSKARQNQRSSLFGFESGWDSGFSGGGL